MEKAFNRIVCEVYAGAHAFYLAKSANLSDSTEPATRFMFRLTENESEAHNWNPYGDSLTQELFHGISRYIDSIMENAAFDLSGLCHYHDISAYRVDGMVTFRIVRTIDYPDDPLFEGFDAMAGARSGE